jgi:hypothetical protein
LKETDEFEDEILQRRLVDNDSPNGSVKLIEPVNQVFTQIQPEKRTKIKVKQPKKNSLENIKTKKINQSKKSTHLNSSKNSNTQFYKQKTTSSMVKTPQSKSTNFLFKNNLESIKETLQLNEIDESSFISSNKNSLKNGMSGSMIIPVKPKQKFNHSLNIEDITNVRKVKLINYFIMNQFIESNINLSKENKNMVILQKEKVKHQNNIKSRFLVNFK